MIAGCGARSLDPQDIGPGGDTGAGGGGGGTGGSVVSPIGDYTPGPCLQPATDPALARFQAGIVGHWMGTATTPVGWDWSDGTVEFAFYCDGHYQSRCAAAGGRAPESCVALYYGTDADDPLKTYEINDVRADGKAMGDIVIFFGMTDVTNDHLEAIALDAGASTLAFDLIHLRQYGPVHYQLDRQPRPE